MVGQRGFLEALEVRLGEEEGGEWGTGHPRIDRGWRSGTFPRWAVPHAGLHWGRCPTKGEGEWNRRDPRTCGFAVWGCRMHLLRTCERLGFRRATNSGWLSKDRRRQQHPQHQHHQQHGDARERSTSGLLGAAPPRPGKERASCEPSYPSSPSNHTC